MCHADLKKIEWAKNTEQNFEAKLSVKLLNCHKHCKILSWNLVWSRNVICAMWHSWLEIYSIREIFFPTWACFSRKIFKLVLNVVSSIHLWYKQAMLHFFPKSTWAAMARLCYWRIKKGMRLEYHTQLAGNGFVGFVWQRNSQVINCSAFGASWAERKGHRESWWTLVWTSALFGFWVELRRSARTQSLSSKRPDNLFHSQEIVSCVTKPLQILLASSGKYFWVQPHTVACKFCYSVSVGNILWVIYV